MRYDRPVWQLFEDCARALPSRFRFADVERWFAQNYPDIETSTLRVHLRGLSIASAKRPHPHLAKKPPLFRIVGHGEYELLRGPRRAEPEGAPPDQHLRPAAREMPDDELPDIVLISCVKSKRGAPSAAKDLYVSALFHKARAYAELTGRPWMILSAEHGLVLPDEWLSPYERYLPDTSDAYRQAWGEWVVRRLELIHGGLSDAIVEIHASRAYVEPVGARIERLGGHVRVPLDGLTHGRRLQWYDNHQERPSSSIDAVRVEAGPDDLVVSLCDALTDYGRAIPARQLDAVEVELIGHAGLYSWWVDPEGADDMSDGLGMAVSAGLIYAGQAGATRYPSGKQSSNDLAGRLIRMHVQGRALMSTFRHTLAAVLWRPLRLVDLDDPTVNEWVREHLWVVPVPVDDRDGLAAVESAVLAELDPPFNLRGMEVTPLRTRVTELRADHPTRS